MKNKGLVTAFCVGFCLFFFSSITYATPITLKNDHYNGTPTEMALQAGFVTGESFASVFAPTGYPMKVLKVQVLIAHPTGAQPSDDEYMLTLYEHDPSASDPGLPIFEEVVIVTSSNNHISEIQISPPYPIIHSGKHLRVSIRQEHDGTPSIVRDNGPRESFANLIHGNIGMGMSWYWLEELDNWGLVVQGNWIIRVVGDIDGLSSDSGPVTVLDGGPVTFPDSGPVTVLDSGPGTTPDRGGTAKPDTGVAQKNDTGSTTTPTEQDSGTTSPHSGTTESFGGEGQSCYPNSTCNDGLSCQSNLCVEPVSQGCAISQRTSTVFKLIPILALSLFLVWGIRRRRT